MANDHGDDTAHEHGDGCGYGGGDGDGYGYGGGCGYGYGGYGPGDGPGDGYGIVIGRVGRFEVVHLAPWSYVNVGCEMHSIAHWRANWRKIARKHRVVVDCDFEALLDRVDKEVTA
jgi:hypothetical protein